MKLPVYILSGGQSSRMGTDKGLLLWKGKPLVQYVIDAVEPTADSITVVTANPEYSQFGWPLVADLQPGLGPAGGLSTAFNHAGEEHLLILSCDIPLIRTDILLSLLNRLEKGAVNMPVIDDREHPLCAVYPTLIRKEWDNYLARGERKMRSLIRNFRVNKLSFPGNEKAFTNVNTLDDLIKLET